MSSAVLGPATLQAIENLTDRRRQRAREVWTAMMLAPSLEIWEALLREEDVPMEQLDQEWVRRLGLKR
jgi:hypothetical protein